MGGADKAALRVRDKTLLDGVLAAARPFCGRLVVVGPVRPTTWPGVIFTLEEEPGSGPVPAVMAGMAETAGADVIYVLAVDLPMLSSGGLERLGRRLRDEGAGAAAAADHQGRPNPLLAAYRGEALRGTTARLRGAEGGAAAFQLLPDDTVTVDLGAVETLNVNTPADLAAAVSASKRPTPGQTESNRDSGLSSS